MTKRSVVSQFTQLLILICKLNVFCYARQVYLFDTMDKDWNHKSGNPGMKIRLTQKGLDHIRDSGMKVLNDILPTIPIPNYSKRFLTAGPIPIETMMEMKNVRVTHFRPARHADIRPIPPNAFHIAIYNSDIAFSGQFKSRISISQLPIEGHGDFRAKASGVSVKAKISLTTDSKGKLVTKISSCQSHVRRFDGQFESGPPLNALIKQYQTKINERLRREMGALICNLIDKFSVGPGKSFLARSAAKMPLNLLKVDSMKIKQQPLLKMLYKIQHNLTLDNTFLKQPRATNNYIETSHRGDIFYDNGDFLYETPFHPKEMPEIEGTDKMLYIYGSEYIFNSFLYQSYINNRLELKLSREDLPPLYGDFLNTTCSASSNPQDNSNPLALFADICLGTIIPSIGEKYPNSHVQFKLIPQGIPEYKLTNGSSYINTQGRALIYIRKADRERQMAVAKVTAKSELNLDVHDSRVYGDVRILQLDTILHRSAVEGLESVNIAQLGPLMRSVLEPPISELFQRGVPIPFLTLFSLDSPVINPKEGYIELSTDFKINTKNLRDSIKKNMFRN